MSQYRPHIASLSSLVPKAEKEAAEHIRSLIGNLDNYARDFASAMALRDFAKASQANPDLPNNDFWTFHSWQMIAGRDGAITLYNFYETIEAISTAAHDHKTINKLVNWDQFRAVRKRFREAFPGVEGLRHTVAHAAELRGTPKSLFRNMLRRGFSKGSFKIATGASTLISSGFTGDTFIGTHQGHTRTYDLTKLTHEKLLALIHDLAQSFNNSPGDGTQINHAINKG